MNIESRESSAHLCFIQDLGLIDYQEAYAIQRQRVADIFHANISYLLLCEHPTVLTLGRLGSKDNILVSVDHLQQKGIRIFEVDRGGEVTLHAPGQLVVYPIFKLSWFKKDLKYYVYNLEKVVIDLLNE